jgi:predicted negative regulator of RcsB-dependent stress response
VAADQPVDVDRLAGLAATRSGSTLALLDTALAAAHLRDGALEEAERDARSSIEFFATTDFLTFHANSAVVLGDVLRAAGRTAEAVAAFQLAKDLYEQKGSRVSVELVAARLAS